MSETAPETPAPPAEVNERLGRVEQAIESLKQLIQGKGPVHAEAQGATQARLSADSTVADEVQAELARRDEAVKRAERDALLGKHEETLVRLTEKQPQSPRRKIEEIMGYHG